MKYFWAAETLGSYLILYMINKSNISIEVLKLYFSLKLRIMRFYFRIWAALFSWEKHIVKKSRHIQPCTYPIKLTSSMCIWWWVKDIWRSQNTNKAKLWGSFTTKNIHLPQHIKSASSKTIIIILIYAIKSLSDLSLIFCNIIFVWQLLLKYNWNIYDSLFYQKLHQQLSNKITQALQQSS